MISQEEQVGPAWCSRPMAVMMARRSPAPGGRSGPGALKTLVASRAPPRPASTTAMSTWPASEMHLPVA